MDYNKFTEFENVTFTILCMLQSINFVLHKRDRRRRRSRGGRGRSRNRSTRRRGGLIFSAMLLLRNTLSQPTRRIVFRMHASAIQALMRWHELNVPEYEAKTIRQNNWNILEQSEHEHWSREHCTIYFIHIHTHIPTYTRTRSLSHSHIYTLNMRIMHLASYTWRVQCTPNFM